MIKPIFIVTIVITFSEIFEEKKTLKIRFFSKKNTAHNLKNK